MKLFNDHSENTNIDINYVLFKGKVMNFQYLYDYDFQKHLVETEPIEELEF
jgi:hypothetical protein